MRRGGTYKQNIAFVYVKCAAVPYKNVPHGRIGRTRYRTPGYDIHEHIFISNAQLLHNEKVVSTIKR